VADVAVFLELNGGPLPPSSNPHPGELYHPAPVNHSLTKSAFVS